GGAALSRSMAAHWNVCFSPDIITWCAWRFCVLTLLLLMSVLPGRADSAASTPPKAEKKTDSAKRTTLFHASLNEDTFEEKIEEKAESLFTGSGQRNEAQPFIERIVFEGNRRIRKDTLQSARA